MIITYESIVVYITIFFIWGYHRNIFTVSFFNALSIGEGLEAAVLLYSLPDSLRRRDSGATKYLSV